MAKISGLEVLSQIPPKVLLMYQAVFQLIGEGMDPGKLHVSEITEKAGIGKGTAYEYFDSRDEIVVYAVVYQVQTVLDELEKGLLERESFQEQLRYMLDEISVQNERKNRFLKLVHLLTNSSEFSKQVRSVLCSKPFAHYRPDRLLHKVMLAAVERGELRRDLPLDYMVYSMGGRVLAYMVAVAAEGLDIELSEMKELVYRGVVDELCEKGE